jgi:hypothetical protein
MEAINGRVGFSDRGPIYLAYVAQVPADSEVTPTDSFDSPPPGALLVPNFVSESEAETLMTMLRFGEDDGGGGDGGGQELKHRQVKHFGFEFDYKINNIGEQIFVKIVIRAFFQCCGSGMFYPGSDHCSIPDPGGKKAPDPGSELFFD